MVRALLIVTAALAFGLGGIGGAAAQGSAAPLNLKQFRKAAAPKKPAKVERIEKPSADAADAMAQQNEPVETTARGFADDPNAHITIVPVRVVQPALTEIGVSGTNPRGSEPPYVVASNELNEIDRAADSGPSKVQDQVTTGPSTTGQSVRAAQAAHRPADFGWLGPLLLSVGIAFAVAIGAAAFVRRKPKPGTKYRS